MLESIIDAIKAEIAEKYIPLPVDADGIPIRLKDIMKGVDKYDSSQEVTGEVIEVSFIHINDKGYVTSVAIRKWSEDKTSWYRVYLDPHADIYHHVKERTVEDVLNEFGRKFAENYHYPNADNLVSNTADELRNMMESDESC